MVAPQSVTLFSMDIESQTWVENNDDDFKEDPVYEDDGDKDDPVYEDDGDKDDPMLPTIDEDMELDDYMPLLPPVLERQNAFYMPHPQHNVNQ